MAVARALLLALAAQMAAGKEVLKVGGIIQPSGTGLRGKVAIEKWRDWVNAQSSLDWEVSLSWFGDASAADYTAVVQNYTNTSLCSTWCVDVIICPYTTGSSKKLISGVPSGSNIPILVWGGASDSIFSNTCTGRKCYGTLTKASLYTTPSLAAIKAKNSTFSIATITNNNGFSKSVDAGTKAWITANSGVTLLAQKTLTVAKASITSADETMIDAVIAAGPDVVAIAGHPGDMEDVVMRLRSHATYKPKAIIATNAFTSLTKYAAASKTNVLPGVIMPDQWAKDATATDSLTSWTTSSFTTLMQPEVASYHPASAAAGVIAVSHAMQAGTTGSRKSTLATKMTALAATPTFYGSVSFASDGSIMGKPMYGRQWVSNSLVTLTAGTVVIPPNTNLVYPMPDVVPVSSDLRVSGCATVKAIFAFIACLATYALA